MADREREEVDDCDPDDERGVERGVPECWVQRDGGDGTKAAVQTF